MFQFIVFAMITGSVIPMQETFIETSGDISECVITTERGDQPMETRDLLYPANDNERSILFWAEALWVDRNHQAAIADEVAISGNGQGILASWYLNYDRLSRYVISGTGVPLWSYDMPDNTWGMDVSAGSGTIFAGLSGSMGLFAWLTPSSTPSLELEPSRNQDISSDGSFIVYSRSDGTLICWDCAADTELWSTQLQTIGFQINGVEISGDGSRVFVSVYDAASGAMVFDMSDGSQVGAAVGNYGQTKGDISHDGSRIVTGDFYGRIKLYEFNGTDWIMEGNIATGDSWVTAVSISGDGETAAGGTLAFSPYSGRIVAVDWPSSGVPSVAWQYTDYGDEVSSIDICYDGAVLIVGSWGMYAGTSGDVVTVLDNTGSVIFNLLDDIDEPGSIFSVSVSEDGSFATASGKAVHAREMGNGGQVYGIRIVEAGDHDVAVIAISSPQENLQVGDTVSPEVTVSNPGLNQESFSVHAMITEVGIGTIVWSDDESVTGLNPGENESVVFADWTVPDYGNWIFTSYTELSGDTYPENDTLSTGTRAFHDAKAKSIICPYLENTVFQQMVPMVEVSNTGTYPDAFNVILEITPSGGSAAYLDTMTTSTLSPGAAAVLNFPAWAPQEVNTFTAALTVELTGDFNPDNDSTSIVFDTSYEIIYDDGSYESYYWVGSEDNDMFAERFTPVLTPPMTITGARAYVNSSDAFEWVAVCPDDGAGLPDVLNPIQVVNDPFVPSPPAWLEIPFDIWLSSTDEVWLVAKWYDAKALGVGTDLSAPVTGRCWWHNRQSGWVNFTTGDYSFRLTIEPSTGTGENSGIPAVYSISSPRPNPSAGLVSLQLSIPETEGQVSLSVYDLSGRCVDSVVSGVFKAGEHTVVWDPSHSSIGSGIYFLRMNAPGTVVTKKLIIIR